MEVFSVYDALVSLYLYFEENWMEGTPEWSPETIKSTFNTFLKANTSDKKMMYTTLRKALTGAEHGPDIAQIMFILGKKECFERIMSNLLA